MLLCGYLLQDTLWRMICHQGDPSGAKVRGDSYREILEAITTNCEDEAFWSGLFEELKEREGVGVHRAFSITISASRRRLRPPCFAHLSRCAQFTVQRRS